MPAVPYDRAVLVHYGSDGFAPTWKLGIDQHARALADLGILALLPDYFQKASAVSHNSSVEVFSQVISRHDEWASKLRDAELAVKNLPDVDSIESGCWDSPSVDFRHRGLEIPWHVLLNTSLHFDFQ
ncbi:MAG: hypothetical protein JNK90_03310 [Planctomycetaceae bacterium]|nr:hypothetical protein [Planctomycetaceae bacterium]